MKYKLLVSLSIITALVPARGRADNYFSVTPCRLLDTRGGPQITAIPTTIQVTGSCGVPANATALAGNLTAIPPAANGYMRLSPAGTSPGTTTLNYRTSNVRANNFIMQLSWNGRVDLISSPAADAVVDVTGYFAEPWRIYSKIGEGEADAAYFGFPHQMQRGSYSLTTYNSTSCPPPACPDGDCGGVGIDAGPGGQAVFGAPDSSYWNFQTSAVGKILYDGTNRFYNPRTGFTYPFIMYFTSQQLPKPVNNQIFYCGNNGFGAAYSFDGINFVEGPTTPQLSDCNPIEGPPGQFTCSNADYWCGAWPCDTGFPRHSWTTAEILAQFIWAVDNKYYAAAFLYNSPNFADCSTETSFCYGSDPSHSGTSTWILQSNDGLNWSRYSIDNGDNGRLSRVGIDNGRTCYNAAWLFNVDIAYDPAGQDFYMTRAYASNYGNYPCGPEKLPDRIQLYKTHAAAGLFYGPWELLLDGGCENLGYPMDSASIVHDGTGNVIKGVNGEITLLVSSSLGYSTYQNACAIAPWPRYRVVVGP